MRGALLTGDGRRTMGEEGRGGWVCGGVLDGWTKQMQKVRKEDELRDRRGVEPWKDKKIRTNLVVGKEKKRLPGRKE